MYKLSNTNMILFNKGLMLAISINRLQAFCIPKLIKHSYCNSNNSKERKLELQKLKPFYWGSLLIDGFILVILMGRFYQLPFLKTDSFLVMVILLIEVANLYMMLTVRNRQQQLGIQDISQKSIMMYVFGGLIVLLIVGLALLSSQWGAIGVISGGVVGGIVMLVRQRRSKNS